MEKNMKKNIYVCNSHFAVQQKHNIVNQLYLNKKDIKHKKKNLVEI